MNSESYLKLGTLRLGGYYQLDKFDYDEWYSKYRIEIENLIGKSDDDYQNWLNSLPEGESPKWKYIQPPLIGLDDNGE